MGTHPKFDHDAVLAHVARLELLIQSGSARQLDEQLEAFAWVLARHFHIEESDGYFTDVLATKPELERRVEGLRAQHTEILAQLDTVASTDATPEGIENFIVTLRAHEADERELLQDATLQDLGTGD